MYTGSVLKVGSFLRFLIKNRKYPIALFKLKRLNAKCSYPKKPIDLFLFFFFLDFLIVVIFVCYYCLLSTVHAQINFRPHLLVSSHCESFARLPPFPSKTPDFQPVCCHCAPVQAPTATAVDSEAPEPATPGPEKKKKKDKRARAPEEVQPGCFFTVGPPGGGALRTPLGLA